MAGEQPGGAPEVGGASRPSAGPLFFVGIVASILLVGATLYTLRDILTKGRIEQWSYVFEDARLLPERDVALPPPEGTIRIFYRGKDGGLASYVHRMRGELQQVERERAVLELLFSPPPSPRLEPAIPEGTRLRAFYVVERSGYLDVTKEFLQPKTASPEAERLAVYALVNALVLNNAGVDAVQILVEGRSIQSPWGWMDCSSPLGANLSLINQGG